MVQFRDAVSAMDLSAINRL